jgi:hypothetical protein
LSEIYKSEIDSAKRVAEEGYKIHLNTLDSLFLAARGLNYSDSYICQVYYYIPVGGVVIRSGFFVKKNSPLQEPFNLKLAIVVVLTMLSFHRIMHFKYSFYNLKMQACEHHGKRSES